MVTLGEDTLWYMSARDCMRTGGPIVRKNLMLTVPEKANDHFAKYVRRKLKRK
jgi:hypothetical protein